MRLKGLEHRINLKEEIHVNRAVLEDGFLSFSPLALPYPSRFNEYAILTKTNFLE